MKSKMTLFFTLEATLFHLTLTQNTTYHISLAPHVLTGHNSQEQYNTHKLLKFRIGNYTSHIITTGFYFLLS